MASRETIIQRAMRLASRPKMADGGTPDWSNPELAFPVPGAQPQPPIPETPTPQQQSNYDSLMGWNPTRMMANLVMGGGGAGGPETTGAASSGNSGVLNQITNPDGGSLIPYRAEMAPAQGYAPQALYYIEDEYGTKRRVDGITPGARLAPPGSSLGQDGQLYSETNPVGLIGKALYLSGTESPASTLYNQASPPSTADTPGEARRNTSWNDAAKNTLASLSPGYLIDSAERTLGLGAEVMEGKVAPNDVMRNLEFVGNVAGGGGAFAKTGAAGIFGGRLAATADHAALARAEQMAAKGAQDVASLPLGQRTTARQALAGQIYRETGWFQGPDGKWRFEIADNTAGYNPAVHGGQVPLPDVLDHPELYAAYPQLKDMSWQAMQASEAPGSWGDFDPSTGAIRVSDSVAGRTAAGKSVTLHEATHGIQGIEGFTGGTNLSRADDFGHATQVHEDRVFDATLAYQDAMRAYKLDPTPQNKRTAMAASNELAKIGNVPSGRDLLDAYRRQAGEVEARNVQDRVNMDADERRMIPPWETQDIPTAEQFVQTPQPGMVPAAHENTAATMSAIAQSENRNMTPFYGEDVGPKGRIPNPALSASELNLKSGLPGAPKDGFFNPATAALLQAGVAPKQTVTYYAKQMGSRGGKLPPGMWEKATKGLGPDTVVERDWLVQRIDDHAPKVERRKFSDSDNVNEGDWEPDGSGGIAIGDNWRGQAQYQDYATQGPFTNYTETAVGYPTRGQIKPSYQAIKNHEEYWNTLNAQIRDQQEKVNELRRQNSTEYGNAIYDLRQLENRREDIHKRMVDETAAASLPGQFTDSHFDHPNLEGWYRTQDAELNGPPAYGGDRTRIIEEVQPQRYQKMRDTGSPMPPETIARFKESYDAAEALHDEIVGQAAEYLKLDADQARNLPGLRMRLNEAANGTLERAGDPRAFKLRDMLSRANEVRSHLGGQLRAAHSGVKPSPYTHDVNAATDFLLKNAVRDAAEDGIDKLAWTPGEAQADRYNKLLRDVKALRYDRDTGNLIIDRGRGYEGLGRVAPEKLADTVGKDAATRLLDERAPRVADLPSMNVAEITFPQGMTIGGDGMKGFYGSGPTAEGGILPSRIKSLWKKITGQEPDVKPQTIIPGRENAGMKTIRHPDGGYTVQFTDGTLSRPMSKAEADGISASGSRPDTSYPSVPMDAAMRQKVKKVGLSLYSNAADEKMAAALGAVARNDINFREAAATNFVKDNGASLIYSRSATPNEFYVGAVYVEPEARGQGRGSALMSKLVGRADADNVSLRLMAGDEDGIGFDTIQKFYRSHGFEPVGGIRKGVEDIPDHIEMVRPSPEGQQAKRILPANKDAALRSLSNIYFSDTPYEALQPHQLQVLNNYYRDAARASREIGDGFYSPSLEAIKAVKQEKGTVAQFRSMILDPKFGGKEKELAAVGFDRAFPDQNAKVTRQQIEDFLRDNRVTLGRDQRGSGVPVELKFKPLETDGEWDSYHAVTGPNGEALSYAIAGNADGFKVINSGSNQRFRTFDEAKAFVQDKLTYNNARFEGYSTPGGSNYRETVTTLPSPSPDYERLRQLLRQEGSKEGEAAEYISNLRTSRRVPDYLGNNQELIDLIAAAKKFGPEQTYTSSHWPSVDNPLLHYRTKDFPGVEGGKTKVVDEFQSDWAQRGRDQGFKDPRSADSLKLQRDEALNELSQSYIDTVELTENDGLINAIKSHGNMSASDQAYVALEAKARTSPEAAEAIKRIDAAQDKYSDLQNKFTAAKSGVPDGPFIKNTSDWTDLAIKQALIDSARDPAVNRMAWTPGEVQAKRYNLSNHVNSIDVIPVAGSNTGKGRISIAMTGGTKPRFEFDAKGTITSASERGYAETVGKNLSELVGEDLSKKILSTPQVTTLRGIDLDVGGHGMVKYYGSGPEAKGGIVPQRIKDIVKKLDPRAAKIEPTAIRKQSELMGTEGLNYPSIPVTDAMRQKIINEGLSLFNASDPYASAILSTIAREGLEHFPEGTQFGLPLPEMANGVTTTADVAGVTGRKLDPNGFYSVLDEALGKEAMKQGTAQQWLNAVKRHGTKDAEIYWRGLDDFLKTKKPNEKFTKDEVRLHLEKNKVELYGEKHTQDGDTPDNLREREREYVSENFRYGDFDPKDYGYTIEKMEPTENEIKRAINDMRVVDEGDGSFAIRWKEESFGKMPALEYFDTEAEANAALREHAIKSLEDDGENWAIKDDDGSVISDEFLSEDEAMRAAQERAVEAEIARIDDMTDEELFANTDSSRGEDTSNYIKDEAPGDLKEYRETPLVLKPETVARKGSKGWPKKGGGDVHPDSPYNNSPGWRLESEYPDMMNPRQSGTVAHEIQSRWAARGADKGWKKDVPKEELDSLLLAAHEAERAIQDADPDRYRDIGYKVIKIKDDVAQPYRIWSIAYDLKRKIDADKRDVEILEQRIADVTKSPDSNTEHYLRNYQTRLEEERASLKKNQEAWDRDVAPYIDHVLNPTDESFRDALTPELIAYNDWQMKVDQARLRHHEANSRYKSASEGVDPGPWVTEKSDIMALLLKHGLYEAAERGDDFFGVQGPKRMKARWGDSGPHEDYGRIDPKTGKESAVIPMTLQKLARMHDKNSKVEPLYPGRPPVARGRYEEKPYRTAASDLTDEPRFPFEENLGPTPDGVTPGTSGGGKRGMEAGSTRKVSGVVLAKDDAGNPVYVLRVGSEERKPEYQEYLAKGKGTAYLTSYKGEFNKTGLQTFRSKEAAENAMAEINKSLADDYRRLRNPEALKESFEKDDPVGEPFNAIRLTPELRESIVKKGFPLFVNADEKVAAALAAVSQGDRRSRAKALGHFETPFYHGTTHDIKPTKGFADPAREGVYETESHHGRAIYASTDYGDANMNYAGTGPDLTGRITRDAERMEYDVESWTPEERAKYKRYATLLEKKGDMPDYYGRKDDSRLAYAKAHQQLVGKNKQGVMHKLSVNPKNPVILGEFESKRETYFEPDHQYSVERLDDDKYIVKDRDGDTIDTFDDEESAYDLADEYNYSQEPAIVRAVDRVAHDPELTSEIAQAVMDGGLPASKFEEMIRNSEAAIRLIDDGMSTGQVIQDIYRELGYDGVIMTDPDKKFKNMGIGRGTVHIALFDNRRVRDYDKAKYDPKKVDSTSLLAANANKEAPAALATMAARELSAEDEKQVSNYRAEGLFLRPNHKVQASTVPTSAFNGNDIRASQTTVDPKGVKWWLKKIEAGERPSVLLEKTDAGNYRIVDGHTRATAYNRAKVSDIPVLLREEADAPVVDHVDDSGVPNYLEPAAKRRIGGLNGLFKKKP